MLRLISANSHFGFQRKAVQMPLLPFGPDVSPISCYLKKLIPPVAYDIINYYTTDI